MSRALISILVIAAILPLLLAAIPPLSKERLMSGASLVVTGRVRTVAIETRDVSPGHLDRVFHVSVIVDSVEKGTAQKGATVTADMWQPAKRPDGWVGPQGQNHTPAEGEIVRCYLRGDATQGFHFLEPNGLERIKPAASSQRATG